MPHEWPHTDPLANALDTLVQCEQALWGCYVLRADVSTDEFERRLSDVQHARGEVFALQGGNVQNQAAMTIVALALAPHGEQTTAHLDDVVNQLAALLAPRVAALLETKA